VRSKGLACPNGHQKGNRTDASFYSFPIWELRVVSHIGKWHSLLMRIIARKNIVAYFTTHPLTRASLTHWLEVAENADWSSTIEVMADFSKAKTVAAERVRFEVAGGDHRMIVAFHFRRGIAFIKFIGTHAEYDRIDAATVDQF
jgi:mRNA interferase HigB